MKAQLGDRAKRILLTPEGRKKLYDALSKRSIHDEVPDDKQHVHNGNHHHDTELDS